MLRESPAFMGLRWNKDMKKTYVYFISEGIHGPVKVGYAYDIARRMSFMQSLNSRELKFRFAIGCESTKEAKALEKRLHHCLRHYYIRGEWFRAEAVSHAKIFVDELSGGRPVIKSLDV